MADGTPIGKGYVEVVADTTKLDAAMGALPRQVNAATQKAGMSGAMGLMVLSQTIDDLQYGFKNIINQVPQLGMGLASIFGKSAEAGMKFGAVAGIAAVAMNVLINHAGEWITSLGLFASETKRSSDALEALTERIKELESKPVKLAVDTFEIDQAKKKLAELEAAAKAFKRMGETQSSGEKASGEAVSQKFSNLGAAKGDQIQVDLKAKMAAELLAQSETIKEVDREVARAAETQRKAELRLQHSGSMGGQRQALDDIETAKARVKAAQEAAAKARLAITGEGGEAEREVGKIWSEATKGNVEAQKALIWRLKAIGQESLAKGIAGVSPDLVETPEKKLLKKQSEGIDEDNRKAFDDWKKLKAEAQEKENTRLAGAMTNSVGQSYLNTPGMDDADLQDQVKTAMAKSGMKSSEVDAAAEGVAKKIREKLDEAVQVRSLDKGISVDAARAELAKEAQAKDDKQANLPKSEVMSTGSYLNKVLVAGLSKSSENVPKDQLIEAKKTNDILGNVLKEVAKPQKAIPAIVGPGR